MKTFIKRYLVDLLCVVFLIIMISWWIAQVSIYIYNQVQNYNDNEWYIKYHGALIWLLAFTIPMLINGIRKIIYVKRQVKPKV